MEWGAAAKAEATWAAATRVEAMAVGGGVVTPAVVAMAEGVRMAVVATRAKGGTEGALRVEVVTVLGFVADQLVVVTVVGYVALESRVVAHLVQVVMAAAALVETTVEGAMVAERAKEAWVAEAAVAVTREVP